MFDWLRRLIIAIFCNVQCAVPFEVDDSEMSVKCLNRQVWDIPIKSQLPLEFDKVMFGVAVSMFIHFLWSGKYVHFLWSGKYVHPHSNAPRENTAIPSQVTKNETINTINTPKPTDPCLPEISPPKCKCAFGVCPNLVRHPYELCTTCREAASIQPTKSGMNATSKNPSPVPRPLATCSTYCYGQSNGGPRGASAPIYPTFSNRITPPATAYSATAAYGSKYLPAETTHQEQGTQQRRENHVPTWQDSCVEPDFWTAGRWAERSCRNESNAKWYLAIIWVLLVVLVMFGPHNVNFSLPLGM